MPAPAREPDRSEPRPRRTQERGEVTQRKLLTAAIASLIEDGYAGMSTTRVSERAGISRGAQQHHFRQKSELVAEAVRHLAEQRTAELTRSARDLPDGPERLEGAVDMLWESFSGELFEASVELWVAARTDAALRHTLIPVEHRVAESITAMTRELFGEAWAAEPGADDRIQHTINTIRGLALLRMLQHDAATVERQWRFARATLIGLLQKSKQN